MTPPADPESVWPPRAVEDLQTPAATSGSSNPGVDGRSPSSALDANGTAAFTNTRDLTHLDIIKNQRGGATRNWLFDVSCTNAAGDSFAQSGVVVVGSGTTRIEGVPTGMTCSVTESNADADGFTTTPGATQDDVAVGADGGSVSFTNTRDTTSLEIAKTQAGGVWMLPRTGT